MHAEDIKPSIAFGVAASSLNIASWQDEQSDATAYKIASLPCNQKKTKFYFSDNNTINRVFKRQKYCTMTNQETHVQFYSLDCSYQYSKMICLGSSMLDCIAVHIY